MSSSSTSFNAGFIGAYAQPPESVQDFDFAAAAQQFAQATDENVSDADFSKQHGGVTRHKYIAEGISTLARWDENTASGHIGSQIAEELFQHRLPNTQLQSWLSRLDFELFPVSSGISPYSDARQRHANADKVVGDLVHLLSGETLASKVEQKGVERPTGYRDAYLPESLHGKIDRLQGDEAQKKQDAFHAAHLPSHILRLNAWAEGPFPSFSHHDITADDHRAVLHDLVHMSPDAALTTLRDKLPGDRDGLEMLMPHLTHFRVRQGLVADDGLIPSLMNEWGTDATAQLFTEPGSLAGLRKLEPDHREFIAAHLRPLMATLAHGDLDTLETLTKTLHGGSLRPQEIEAFQAARADALPSRRDELALVLVLRHLGDRNLSGHEADPSIKALTAKVSPEFLMAAFDNSTPEEQKALVAHLPYSDLTHSWSTPQQMQLVSRPAFALALMAFKSDGLDSYWDERTFNERLMPLRESMSDRLLAGAHRSPSDRQAVARGLQAALNGDDNTKPLLMNAVASRVQSPSEATTLMQFFENQPSNSQAFDNALRTHARKAYAELVSQIAIDRPAAACGR